ncbi:MAG: stage II sporulation protein P [Clostridia bacterium]|nr:stage II sporulation protein P [Clostridia bacterium]
MKKTIIVAILCFIMLGSNISIIDSVCAESINEDIYNIYDKYGAVLFQQEGVEVGDMYMGKDFVKYIVTEIDENTKTGFAEEYMVMDKPKVDMNNRIRFKNVNQPKGTVCLYMTHNDESYIPSDGYDSIYGNGGIYDVAKAFRDNLNGYGITAVLDSSLHIPHDTKAYSRSNITANKMFNSFSPDAMFDIHRDAASRSTYLKVVNGQNKGMVRIVIGLSNPYMRENEEFAMYLISVADNMYPWLFKDIYYGQGHYNQAVSSKSLLFEMGCHLIEKEYEIATTKPLAEVINVALYNTTVDEDNGNLTINGDVSNSDITINDALEDYNENRLEQDKIDIENAINKDVGSEVTPNLNVGFYVPFSIIVILLSGLAVMCSIVITYDYIVKNKKKR